MAKNQFTVNSMQTMLDFCRTVKEMYGDGAYIIFNWRIGKQASMPQKALVHIWFRKYASHLLKKPERDLSNTDLYAMKRSAKVHFYNETHESFMVEEIVDPFHPDKKRDEMTSIAAWAQSECYLFMMWLQEKAMHDDLILESIGEHQKLTQESFGK